MSDTPADLTLIARQQQHIIAEMGSMRDDMARLVALLRSVLRKAEGRHEATP